MMPLYERICTKSQSDPLGLAEIGALSDKQSAMIAGLTDPIGERLAELLSQLAHGFVRHANPAPPEFPRPCEGSKETGKTVKRHS
jgi:hypothetical protein